MREIKFRGKTNSGQWIFGSLVYSENIQPAIYFEVGKGAVKRFDWAYVDPKTVGQFTGLQDKNGKDIYEWDIIRCLHCDGDSFDCCADVFVVKYDDGVFDPVFLSKWFFHSCEDYPLSCENVEIIGSIHDNPERQRGAR